MSFPTNIPPPPRNRCCSVSHYYTPVCKSNYNSVCPYYANYLTFNNDVKTSINNTRNNLTSATSPSYSIHESINNNNETDNNEILTTTDALINFDSNEKFFNFENIEDLNNNNNERNHISIKEEYFGCI